MVAKKSAKPTATPTKKARRVVEEEEDIEEEFEDLEEDVEEEEEEEEAPRKLAARSKGKGKVSPTTFEFKDQMTAEDWQRILDQTSGSNGPFYYLKEGKVRLRLVAEQGTKTRWFTETVNTFNGRTRTKMIVLAILVSGKGVTDEMKGKVTPVVVAKTVLTQILNLLAEGYDLLSPKRGMGLSITRRGSNLDTAYNVLPSQSPQPLPEGLQWPEKTLAELADEYEANSSNRDSERVKSRRRKNEDDDDDEGGGGW